MFSFFLDQGLNFTLDFILKYLFYLFVALIIIYIFAKAVTFLIITAIGITKDDDLKINNKIKFKRRDKN